MAAAEQKLLDTIRTFLPDVPATIHDLKNPSRDFACRIYLAILVELGVNSNCLKSMQANQGQMITYSDMFTDIIPCLNVSRGINYFLSKIGICGFGLSDLLWPDPKRNLFFASKLLQFISYSDDMIGRIQLDELIQKKMERYNLLMRLEEMQSRINKRVCERAQNNELMWSQERSVENLRNHSKKLTAKKEVIETKIEDSKKLLSERAETIMKFQFLETKFTREMKNLEDMDEQIADNIIEKKEQLINYRDELKKNIEDIINQSTEKKNMIVFISNQIERYQQRHKELQCILNLHKHIQWCEAEMNSYSERLKRIIDKQEEAVREDEVIRRDINSQHATMNDHLKYEQQKLSNQKEKLNTLNREYEELKAKLLQANAEVKQYEKLLQHLKRDKKILEDRWNRFNDTIRNSFDEIEKSEAQFNDITKVIDNYAKVIVKAGECAKIKLNTSIFNID